MIFNFPFVSPIGITAPDGIVSNTSKQVGIDAASSLATRFSIILGRDCMKCSFKCSHRTKSIGVRPVGHAIGSRHPLHLLGYVVFNHYRTYPPIVDWGSVML
jgi:hypothetical protein